MILFVKKAFKSIKSRIENNAPRIFSYFYEKKQRRRLKNHDFSILCPSCIGGVIYHRLGQRFLSPTINLWMRQRDFLKFVSNLEQYINKELVFVEGVVVAGKVCDYPVAKLGDVLIFFKHSNSKEEAKADWEKRKVRINYDNLYLIIYDREDITFDDLIEFGKIECANKIILTSKKYDNLPYAQTIIPHPTRLFSFNYLDKDFFGKRTFEKQWDYVRWLNTNQGLKDLRL